MRIARYELLLAAAGGLAVLALYNAVRAWRLLRAAEAEGCGDPTCRICYPAAAGILRLFDEAEPLPTSTALAEAVDGATREVLEAKIVPPASPATDGAA